MESSVLERLKDRTGSGGAAAYAGVLCLVVLAVSGALGLALHQPWLFPSLGPTVMLFFESPRQASSRPLNALVGHGVALLVGIALFYAFGLQDSPSAAVGGLKPGHVLAGALSVAVTTLVLTWVKAPHPPAGATTLIVSLGVLRGTDAWLSMAGAIILITALGWGLNVLLGTRPLPRQQEGTG
jgi:CBS-domain-containing membrane protein